ncbi:hypothetical protein [Mariniblastus fucicola]|uniref:MucB/RseB N-terminal domain-containing protein n=1 Tax=Mariniblastus fucicola TaxID=980251 RepID=A0A5B9PI99_9BACT|nr:hypothetical protein [Mariniblastus fucicola]QEG24995.1 hypothetical protein MFFC18_49180 [Mariniblastus fucicola]
MNKNYLKTNDDDLDRSDDLLKQTLKGIRQEEVPDFPDPPLGPLPSTSLHADGKSVPWSAVRQASAAKSSGWLSRSRLFVIAAAAVVLAALLLWPQSSQSAFAKVQAALEEVRSVSYSVFDYHANGDAWETNVSIVESGLTRSEQIKVGEGTVANGLQISNWNENLRMIVDHKSRKATFYEVSPDEESVARRNRWIEKFRNIPERATQDLGPTTFDGKPVHSFEVLMGEREFKVYVDVETNLPVRMEYMQEETGFREVFSNFVFDGGMDMSQFALEAPEGYTVEHVALEPPPADADLLVVSPTIGIGPVPFGADADSVIEFLGEPAQRRKYAPFSLPGSDQPRQGFEYLKYNSLGLEIGINSEHGITTIRCFSQRRTGPSVHDFAGQTPEGIRIGSTLPEVIAAYGEPDLMNDRVTYLREGWTFSISDDKVEGIEVSEPIHEDIEIIVNDDGSSTQRVRPRD